MFVFYDTEVSMASIRLIPRSFLFSDEASDKWCTLRI